MLAANAVIALMVAAKGERLQQLPAMVPLPFLLAAFKWYCSRTFDDQMHYYNKGINKGPEASALPDKETRHGDRVSVRFGHPALYKPLMTPMVHAKARNALNQIYRGRLDSDDGASVAGYSDTYNLHQMSRTQPGKKEDSAAPFEIVTEAQMDFENFKNRPEFREEFGGDGEVYGKPSDLVRPGTPASAFGSHGRSSSRDSNTTYASEEGGTSYPAGYHSTPNARNFSPDRKAFGAPGTGISSSGAYGESDYNLLRGAAPMGSANISRGSTPLQETPGSEGDTAYDYFRGRRK
jgi:calcium permeable stress-gated cation channel